MGGGATLLNEMGRNSWVPLTILSVVLYYSGRALYRIFLHPLSKFPGPKLRAISHLPQVYSSCTGIGHSALKDLHDRYGRVVRISPMSFRSLLPRHLEFRWLDIYGFVQGRRQIPKDNPHFYNAFEDPMFSILNADDENHARIRRLISHAFSTQALQEEEPLITKYFDSLISLLRETLSSPKKKGKVNLVDFYTRTTFDILGDLCFGEPFHALENRGHVWIDTIFRHMRSLSFFAAASFYPPVIFVIRLLLTYVPSIATAKQNFERFPREKVEQRLRTPPGSTRKDFMHFILRHNDERGMTEPEIHRSAEVLIVGGSETTATLLSGATYLLLTNPDCLHKLQTELYSSFPSAADITMKSTQGLPYLSAVLSESLRYYPPVAATLPRVTVIDTVIDGTIVPAGTRIGAPHYASFHSTANFRNPEVFAPERWLDKGDNKEYEGDEKEAWQPFSLGPRGCVGRNLAYAEMAGILARVIYHFDLELLEESADWINHKSYVLWEKPPLMVQLREREGLTKV